MPGPSRLIAANDRNGTRTMLSNSRRRTRSIRSALRRELSRYIYFLFVLRETVVFPTSSFCRYGDSICCGLIVDVARYTTCLCGEEFNGTLEHLKVAHLPADCRRVGREKFRTHLPFRFFIKSISYRHSRGSFLGLRRSDEFNALHGY